MIGYFNVLITPKTRIGHSIQNPPDNKDETAYVHIDIGAFQVFIGEVEERILRSAQFLYLFVQVCFIEAYAFSERLKLKGESFIVLRMNMRIILTPSQAFIRGTTEGMRMAIGINP